MAHLPRRRTCCRATNLDMDFFVVHDAETRQRSTSLPPELSLIVTDTLACSATFVLTTFLCRTLREPKRPIVLVSLSQTLSRYTAICRKAVRHSPAPLSENEANVDGQGVQLDNALVRPRFRFVDGLNVLASPVQDSESDGHVLQALHSSIADALAVLLNPRPPTPSRPAASADPFPPVAADVPGVTTPVIIVDDLTALLWSGAASASSLKTFYRSLQLLVKPVRGLRCWLGLADKTPASTVAPSSASSTPTPPLPIPRPRPMPPTSSITLTTPSSATSSAPAGSGSRPAPWARRPSERCARRRSAPVTSR
jgi:hypothetical protein